MTFGESSAIKAMNFFEYYDLSMSFHVDEAELRKAFHQKSKMHHPDLYLGNDEKYNQALEESGKNNRAYQALKSFHGRVKYILDSKGLLEDKQELPPMFLMEMMEFNEGLMDAQMSGQVEKLTSLKEEFDQLKTGLEAELNKVTEEWDQEPSSEKLESVKSLYLKQKYLNRIQESFQKMAG
jgi:molecular chaperone HscB